MTYILSIDQGTTSTRSIIFDKDGTVLGSSQIEHKQYYPQKSWVEHDANEIKKNVLKTMVDAVNNANISWKEIISIGITNQRETVVAWDKRTGEPIGNAIVWQCRRTIDQIKELKKNGYEELFLRKTGLVLDAYFSGTKMRWILDHSDIENIDLAFGTIDSWIIFFLTGNHKTDASNASRTLLYDIVEKHWSEELCNIIGVPIQALPEITSNASNDFGYFEIEDLRIPIRGVLGDQQAALFGQVGFSQGAIKATYGTGNFILLNIGQIIQYSSNKLLTTIAWEIAGEVTYALEGSVFITGAAIKWLRDGLGIINDYNELDELTMRVTSSEGVFFVPAFVGLGAPHWDSSATGTIIGISGATTKSHLIHATYDAIAFQTAELIKLMSEDTNIMISSLFVDGGATQSDILLQKQADISNIDIVRPTNIETTALGAALMAGYGVLWNTFDEMKRVNSISKVFSPKLDPSESKKLTTLWSKAVAKSKDWF